MIFFLEYLVVVVDNLDRPTFIEEWKQNLDAAAYKKSKQICKVTINLKNDRYDKT